MGITAGIDKEDYTATGRYKYTLAQLTSPFELTFEYIKADYRSFFAYYGAEHDPSEEVVKASAREYVAFIERL